MRVFLSFRRDDHDHVQASALKDAIALRLAALQPDEEPQVFCDLDSIPPGSRFERVIRDWLHGADVMLVLIGNRWADAERTSRRDWVAWEVQQARVARTAILPVLFDDARFPPESRLQGPLAVLAELNAFRFDTRAYGGAVDRLVEACLALKNDSWWTPTATRVAMSTSRVIGMLATPVTAVAAGLTIVPGTLPGHPEPTPVERPGGDIERPAPPPVPKPHDDAGGSSGGTPPDATEWSPPCMITPTLRHKAGSRYQLELFNPGNTTLYVDVTPAQDAGEVLDRRGKPLEKKVRVLAGTRRSLVVKLPDPTQTIEVKAQEEGGASCRAWVSPGG